MYSMYQPIVKSRDGVEVNKVAVVFSFGNDWFLGGQWVLRD